MLRFRDGDEDAFIQLYRTYRDRMVNYCRRMLGNASLGEEAAQETFLRLYAARSTYTPKSRFSTYLYRIATNYCLNQSNRKERRVLNPAVDAQDVASIPASQHRRLEHDEMTTQVRQAIYALPAQQRTALVLCHFQEQSYAHAASIMEVSEAAVKSLLFRARQSLAKTLVAHEDEEMAHA